MSMESGFSRHPFRERVSVIMKRKCMVFSGGVGEICAFRSVSRRDGPAEVWSPGFSRPGDPDARRVAEKQAFLVGDEVAA